MLRWGGRRRAHRRSGWTGGRRSTHCSTSAARNADLCSGQQSGRGSIVSRTEFALQLKTDHHKPRNQGRNEVRCRPGQEASLAPPCSNLRSFGSKYTVLKKVLATLLAFRRHSQSLGARGFGPLSLRSCPPLRMEVNKSCSGSTEDKTTTLQADNFSLQCSKPYHQPSSDNPNNITNANRVFHAMKQ